jgi:hypothetical protein
MVQQKRDEDRLTVECQPVLVLFFGQGALNVSTVTVQTVEE